MPRGGSRGGSSRSSSPPPRSSFAATRPQPAQQAPMQQPTTQKTGMFSGIGSTIMQGMAFGAGSEVAHQAVRSVMGGSSSHQQAPQQQQQVQQQQQQNPCQMEIQNFGQCLERNTDLSYCQSLSDILKSCRQANGILWSGTFKQWLFNKSKKLSSYYPTPYSVLFLLLTTLNHLFSFSFSSILYLGIRKVRK